MKKLAALGVSLLLAMQPVYAADDPADPYESYNRAMSKFNDKADYYVMSPVARGYRAVTPQPVRTGISNFFNNLKDIVSFGSNLLRLDIKRASEDLVRVGLNTTFGLGGLIDVASAGGVPDNKNTLGDTLASWGWKNSHYVVLPLLGPSTVRDALGSAATLAYPVQNALIKPEATRWSMTGLNAVSTRENLLDLTDSLEEAALDKYSYTRDMYMQVRNHEIGNEPDDADADSDTAESTSESSANDAPFAEENAAAESAPSEAAPVAETSEGSVEKIPTPLPQTESAEQLHIRG